MFEQIKLHRFPGTKIMTSIIRLSLIGIIVATFVGIGILSAQSSLVSNARPSARAKTTGDGWNAAKPTIVLVHGAFADATSWQHVIPILERDGYNVIAVQNALASLAGDVETTKRVIDAQTGLVVVVGHSYGGAVITGAAAENANAMRCPWLLRGKMCLPVHSRRRLPLRAPAAFAAWGCSRTALPLPASLTRFWAA